MTSYVLPNPFPVSTNFCAFQKGSGVNADDAVGCTYYNSQDSQFDTSKLQRLFRSLDDETVWTSQVAIVTECDECIYGPVDTTLRNLIADLRGLCCLSDGCLVGVTKAILCNPILNYRGRYENALAKNREIELQNRAIVRDYLMLKREISEKTRKKCQTLDAIREAMSKISKIQDPNVAALKCCLAECAREFCEAAGSGEGGLPETYDACPCQPVSTETLANACVVIKVFCPSPEAAGTGETCDDSFECVGCGNPAEGSGGAWDPKAYTDVNGLNYKDYCRLPVEAEFEPYYPSDCKDMSSTIVLTFRCGRALVTGQGVVTGHNFYTSFPTSYPSADCDEPETL